MDAPTHTRMPEQAATQSSSRTQGISPSTDANLSLRLWTASGGAGLTPSNWESESPAVCLTLDLIAASEGTVVARQGGDLVAAFPSLPSAIQAARRLQWAFQGFSEAESAQAAAVAGGRGGFGPTGPTLAWRPGVTDVDDQLQVQ